ncbi:hypothetical protein IAU60_000032 [Kwoniella sp. DSM 27419]
METDPSHHSPTRPARAPAGRSSPGSSVAASSPRRTPKSISAARRRSTQIPATPRGQSTQSRRVAPDDPPRVRKERREVKPAKAPLLSTFNLLLTPIRLLLAPVHLVLSPIYAHLANTLLLISLGAAFAYLILPLLPSIVLRMLGRLLRFMSKDLFVRLIGSQTDLDFALGEGLVQLPARTLATPACLLTGLFCQASLLTRRGEDGKAILAKPIWAGAVEPDDPMDVALVARALTKEVRGARDIFDSVRMLGQGGIAGGLEYVRIWELAVAVGTGSTLEDKAMISSQLNELGDMTRDLSDEIVHIDSTTVNAFSWLQWEFTDLVRLLSPEAAGRAPTQVVERKLHTLVLRLSAALESIQAMTDRTAKHAARASAHGQGLYTHLSATASELKSERERSPGWKRVYDKSAHFLVGGEPSKAELIHRDLTLTTGTIANIRALSRNLEETRGKVKAFRDQIGMFEASIMGFHLGATDEVGLGPEEEVRVLGAVVAELGRAVGSAKDRGQGGSLLEIEQV